MLGNASAMKPLVKSSKWRELKFARFFYEERCAQGGAKVLHAYWDEIKKAGLNKEEMKELVDEWFDLVSREMDLC